MRELPILFNTELVCKILARQKWKTRRVMKPNPIGNEVEFKDGKYRGTFPAEGGGWEVKEIKPQYNVGDVLWVRETWCEGVPAEPYLYKANEINGSGYDPDDWRWRPSIHMPRAAARIFLRVTDVRAEQLQGITPEDAKAEGINTDTRLHCYCGRDNCFELGNCPINCPNSARGAYRALWDSIYNKRGFGWNTAPWVWVYTFEEAQV